MKKTSRLESGKKWGLVTLFLVALAATPILILSGCSDNPLATQDNTITTGYFDLTYQDDGFLTGAEGVLVKRGGGGGGGSSDPVYYGEDRIIAADGGVVKISMPGSINEFVVGAGTIPADTTISLSVTFTSYKGSTVGRFSCGPEGLSFSKSADLAFEVQNLGKDENSVDLYWLNSRKKWEFQGTYTAGSDGIVHIPVDHFSMYGVE